MRLRQIRHMDVIADTSAIRRIVIVPEKRHRLTRPDRPEQQRDQMRFRLVVLARTPFDIGSRRVEIPQANAPHAMNLVEPVQQLLHHHLRFAIRVHRRIRLGFHNRHPRRHPVNRRRRRKNNLPDPRLQASPSSVISDPAVLFRKYTSGIFIDSPTAM